jgi:hypothetical protein
MMDIDSPLAGSARSGGNALISAGIDSLSPAAAAALNGDAAPRKEAFDPAKHLLPSKAIPVKKNFLETLGFKSAKKEKNDGINRNCVLRAVITPTPTPSFLFYFENEVASLNFGPWPEKLTADAVKQGLEWAQSVGIQESFYKLVINGSEVRNNRGYAKRVFCCPLDATPDRATATSISRYIAECLNATPGNNTTTLINPDTLFPFGSEPVHWATFVGVETACSLCLERTIGAGQVPMPGYWESHGEMVRTHLGDGGLSPQLTRFFHAPTSDANESEE